MANVSRYDPVSEIFDDVFRGFLVRPVAADGLQSAARIKVEVRDQGDAFQVLADVPGVKKEDIKVTVEGDQVTISAEARQERDFNDKERVLHSERRYGKVARSFQLGQEIDETRAQAKYADGVLNLTLPKKAPVNARQLTIQ